MPATASLGVIFPWDFTHRCVHLALKTLQIVPYFSNFSQFVLNIGTQLNG